MWKRTKGNLGNNNTKKETEKKTEISAAATKALCNELAAMCMAMGAPYYAYFPITPIGYENSDQ